MISKSKWCGRGVDFFHISRLMAYKIQIECFLIVKWFCNDLFSESMEKGRSPVRSEFCIIAEKMFGLKV